jgi:2-polyprenyl-3-methyl-5-hydroxy-6-metoxy-1,4-benzoquinol methylase
MNFSVRAVDLKERMDDPDCDLRRLHNTYRQFGTINRLLAGWRGTYRSWIRPRLRRDRRPVTVLDVGCGGAGLLPDLHRWMARDGVIPHLTGIDTDPRAIDFARELRLPGGPAYRCVSLETLAQEDARFDFVVCNHVLHHLADDAVEPFLDAMRRITGSLALAGDATRTRVGYYLFSALVRPFFRESFIVEDGLLSIRRAFTLDELRSVVPEGWIIRRRFPFHALLALEGRCDGKESSTSPDPQLRV